MNTPPDADLTSGPDQPASPSVRPPQGLQRRGLGLTLLIVEFGVLSSLLLSLSLYIFGTCQTVRELWHELPLIGQPEATRSLLISAIEQTDVVLVATALLIISIGLQALFVQRLDNLPGWLHIRTFDDLKNKLLGILVVALVVEFFKAALKWDGSAGSSGGLLTFGLALAAIILAASAYSLVLSRFSGEQGASPEE